MSEAEPNKNSKERLAERIELLNKHASQINDEPKKDVSDDIEIKDKIKLKYPLVRICLHVPY